MLQTENQVKNFKLLILKKNWRLHKLYQKYQNIYHNKTFIFKEFLYDNNNLSIYAPYTLSESKNQIELSYFGLPVRFYGNELKNIENIKQIIKLFFIKNENLKNKFVFEFFINLEEFIKLNYLALNPYDLYEQQYIDLSLEKTNIINNFKLNMRNEIKKNYKLNELSVKIVDHNNYTKNHILKIASLHEKVSKRKTRSKTTWLINEQMIVNKQGFLVEISFQKKLISSSFFFHNNFESFYFSSASLRDNLPSTGGISIWEAIKYAKDIGLERFNLGITKIINSREICDKKIENILFFKSRFSGVREYIITLDNHSKLF